MKKQGLSFWYFSLYLINMNFICAFLKYFLSFLSQWVRWFYFQASFELRRMQFFVFSGKNIFLLRENSREMTCAIFKLEFQYEKRLGWAEAVGILLVAFFVFDHIRSHDFSDFDHMFWPIGKCGKYGMYGIICRICTFWFTKSEQTDIKNSKNERLAVGVIAFASSSFTTRTSARIHKGNDFYIYCVHSYREEHISQALRL